MIAPVYIIRLRFINCKLHNNTNKLQIPIPHHAPLNFIHAHSHYTKSTSIYNFKIITKMLPHIHLSRSIPKTSKPHHVTFPFQNILPPPSPPHTYDRYQPASHPSPFSKNLARGGKQPSYPLLTSSSSFAPPTLAPPKKQTRHGARPATSRASPRQRKLPLTSRLGGRCTRSA